MIFIDLELAKRLEGVETWVAAEFGRARLAIDPDSDTSVVSVAGGVACFLGEGSPVNESRGLGMAGPVTGDDLDAMERPFLSRGLSSKVTACPLADPSLLAGLAARGYRASGFEDVLFRSSTPRKVSRGRRRESSCRGSGRTSWRASGRRWPGVSPPPRSRARRCWGLAG